jgi:hypothetical protein
LTQISDPSFSGLLGLSAYSDLRQALAGLVNTRAFNNHFEVTAHSQTKAREERSAGELSTAIAKDYEILVGSPLGELDSAAAKSKCHEALIQIAPLKPQCEGKAFADIDMDGCIEAIKDAEGGPKRERLGACIRESGDLAKVNHESPAPERATQLLTRAAERETALERTAGDLMLQLYQAGTQVVETAEWEDPHLCPLCDGKSPHSLRDHLAAKLSEFDALDKATTAIAAEWNEGGWAELLPLETMLEGTPEKRLFTPHQNRASAGTISKAEAEALVQHLTMLRTRAKEVNEELAAEQARLEKELPPFSNKSDALEWARMVETKIDRKELEPDRRVLNGMTLEDVIVRYRDEIVPKKRGGDVETIVLNAFLRDPICKKRLSLL